MFAQREPGESIVDSNCNHAWTRPHTIVHHIDWCDLSKQCFANQEFQSVSNPGNSSYSNSLTPYRDARKHHIRVHDEDEVQDLLEFNRVALLWRRVQGCWILKLRNHFNCAALLSRGLQDFWILKLRNHQRDSLAHNGKHNDIS